MNQIVIGKVEKPEADPQVLSLTYLNANKMLTLLRSDYFRQITLEDVEQVETKTLKFLIQLGRLLKADVLNARFRDQSCSKGQPTRPWKHCYSN